MKNSKYSVALALAMLLGVVSSPVVNAQSLQDTNQGDVMIEPGAGATVDTSDERSGFNLFWLLPLLAIPLLFMIKRDKKNETTEYRDPNFTGSKGGRADRKIIEDLDQY